MAKYNQICIGVDQSYKNTGVTISADNKILKICSINLSKYKTNSKRRKRLKQYLENMLNQVYDKSGNIVCIIERVRLYSQGFVNIDYIKSIGALNSVIVDVMDDFGISVYSVDTRCWKSQVIGTSKPLGNKFNVPKEKWPTILWVIKQGMEESILMDLGEANKVRKSKETFVRENHKYQYNNDAADSAAISMFWFVGNKSKLKKEG